jgi:hypothetical protein
MKTFKAVVEECQSYLDAEETIQQILRHQELNGLGDPAEPVDELDWWLSEADILYLRGNSDHIQPVPLSPLVN